MVAPLIAAALPALISGAASLGGGFIAEAGKAREIENQREFAKSGVRWRVEDAREAGIHPALALGANVPSYTPVGLGSGMAEGVSNMGQDIGRAIDATRTIGEKADAFTLATQSLTLERMGLENQLLQRQIAGTPPFPMASGDYPVPGQSGSAEVRIPTPFGLPSLAVANPELAQEAQNHFGELGDIVYGVANWVDSLARSVVTPAQKRRLQIVVRGGNPNL